MLVGVLLIATPLAGALVPRLPLRLRGGTSLELQLHGRALVLPPTTDSVASSHSSRVLLDQLPPSIRTDADGGGGGVFLHAEFGRTAPAHDVRLGVLRAERLLACGRMTRFWMAPAFCRRARQMPRDTQFLLAELGNGGPYALFMPLVDSAFRGNHAGCAGGAARACGELGQ